MVSVHPQIGDEQHKRDGLTTFQHFQNIVVPNIWHPSLYRMALLSISCLIDSWVLREERLGDKGYIKKTVVISFVMLNSCFRLVITQVHNPTAGDGCALTYSPSRF